MLLGLAILFLICAIILGILGFGVLAAAAGAVLKLIFFIFVVLFVITLISGHRAPEGVNVRGRRGCRPPGA